MPDMDLARSATTGEAAPCPACNGQGGDHRYCMGWHTSKIEREVHGRCFEHCGADECVWLCVDCLAGNPGPVLVEQLTDAGVTCRAALRARTSEGGER